MRRTPKPVPAKKPMSDAAKARRERFRCGDVFLSLHQRYSCEGLRQTETSLGITVTEYELQARCCDCRADFSQYATRAKIRRDALRRRCDDCKKPGRMTTPVWAERMTIALALAPQKAAAARERSAEARRIARANASPNRLETARLRRIEALAAATGQPVPPDISLRDLFEAEQRQICKRRLEHQRAAWRLGLPLSEIAKIAASHRARRLAQSVVAEPEG
jgi:hypothetical protein